MTGIEIDMMVDKMAVVIVVKEVERVTAGEKAVKVVEEATDVEATDVEAVKRTVEVVQLGQSMQMALSDLLTQLPMKIEVSWDQNA